MTAVAPEFASETARRLGLPPATLTRWCRAGLVPATRVGRNWLIDAEGAKVVEELAQARRRLAGRSGRNRPHLPDAEGAA